MRLTFGGTTPLDQLVRRFLRHYRAEIRRGEIADGEGSTLIAHLAAAHSRAALPDTRPDPVRFVVHLHHCARQESNPTVAHELGRIRRSVETEFAIVCE